MYSGGRSRIEVVEQPLPDITLRDVDNIFNTAKTWINELTANSQVDQAEIKIAKEELMHAVDVFQINITEKINESKLHIRFAYEIAIALNLYFVNKINGQP